jgi:hypothetical protein
MTNGIDTTVDAMKPSGARPVVDRVRAQTERDQLIAGDDSVLATRKSGDLLLTWVDLTAHITV